MKNGLSRLTYLDYCLVIDWQHFAAIVSGEQFSLSLINDVYIYMSIQIYIYIYTKKSKRKIVCQLWHTYVTHGTLFFTPFCHKFQFFQENLFTYFSSFLPTCGGIKKLLYVIKCGTIIHHQWVTKGTWVCFQVNIRCLLLSV